MDYTSASYNFAETSDNYVRPTRASQQRAPAALSLLEGGNLPFKSSKKQLVIVRPRQQVRTRTRTRMTAAEKLRTQFQALAAQWTVETMFLSDPRESVLHPAYQRIIGLGAKAVPLVIEQLRQHPDHWFWALRSMTGENPVPENLWGDTAAMREKWLEWWDQKSSA